MKAIKLLFCLSLFSFSFSFCEGQSWKWAKDGKVDSVNNAAVISIATDKYGNVYSVGYFIDTVTFGSITLITKTFNTFIVKYDPLGNVIWAKQPNLLKPNSECNGASIAVDTSGNIYVAGTYVDSISFGLDTLTTNPANYYASTGAFLVKYTPSGKVLWDEPSFSLTEYVSPSTITTDLKNNVYMAGVFVDTLKFGKFLLADTIYLENFLVKFNANGVPLWAKQSKIISVNNPYQANSSSIATDAYGNVFMTGDLYRTVIKFGTYTLSATGTDEELFIVKYDSLGNIPWAKQSKRTCCGGVGAYQLIATDKTGNIYIAGTYSGMLAFDTILLNCSGCSDLSDSPFLMKINSSGHALWAKFDSVYIPIGIAYASWSGIGVSTDEANNVYLLETGNSTNSNNPFNIFPAPSYYYVYIDTASFKINNYSGVASLLVKYDSSGHVLCGSQINGLQFNELGPQLIAATPSGSSIYIGGGIVGAPVNITNTQPYTYVYIGDSLLFGNDTMEFVEGNHLIPFIAQWEPCDAPTGIPKLKSLAQHISLFPNPNNGIFTLALSYPELVSGTQTIEIYNILGARIYNAMLKQVQHDYEMNLSSQPNGVYLYRVISENGDLVGEGKFVIAH